MLDNRRFVIKSGGRYGLIDLNGNVVVPPRFEFLGECREGLVTFRENDLFGFIDSTGAVVFEAQFESRRIGGPHFGGGMAVVERAGKQYYIDRQTGQTNFGPFCCATDFSNGYAAVKVTQDQPDYEIIDVTGDRISNLAIYEVPEIPDWPSDWNMFNCFVRSGERLLVGVFNYRGRCIFEPRYPRMTDFSSGVAGFCEHEDENAGLYGLVNVSGHIVRPPAYHQMSSFHEGLARAGHRRRQFGYIDSQGGWVISPRFQQAQTFSEGLACVTIGRRKGFIDTNGEMVIEPRFRRESTFCNGLAAVEFDDKRAYINKRGTIVWEIPLEEEK